MSLEMFGALPKKGSMAACWSKSDPHLVGEKSETRPVEEAQTKNDPSSSHASLFRTMLSTCGGFAETASILLGPSDCMSCVGGPLGSTGSPRSPRTMRKQSSSKARLKLAHKLKDSPSREGEVVDVPIKLVKSRSGKAVENEQGPVYEPDRSFDDTISAISAYTLDSMARKYPKPLMKSLRAGEDGASNPRNGDELLPPAPARISSDSSNESGQRDQRIPTDQIENDIPFRRNFDKPPPTKQVGECPPTYELIENDIPFFVSKKKPTRRSSTSKLGTRSSFKKLNREQRPDIHDAITPKATGRKTKRKFKKAATVRELVSAEF